MTASDASNGPRHCAPGVGVGQPAWPGRSGKIVLRQLADGAQERHEHFARCRRLVLGQSVAEHREARRVVEQRHVAMQRRRRRRVFDGRFGVADDERLAAHRRERGVGPDRRARDVASKREAKPMIAPMVLADDLDADERRVRIEHEAHARRRRPCAARRRIANAVPRLELAAQRTAVHASHAAESTTSASRARRRRVQIADVGLVDERDGVGDAAARREMLERDDARLVDGHAGGARC